MSDIDALLAEGVAGDLPTLHWLHVTRGFTPTEAVPFRFADGAVCASP